MSLTYTLRNKRYWNITYIHWILILFATFIAISVLLWAYNEMSKPPSTLYEGSADGQFNGKLRFFNAVGATDLQKQTNCYQNGSYIYFYNGVITLSDGTGIQVGEEGRMIRGEICIVTVDNYIYNSNLAERTPARFTFKGYVQDMPVLDVSGWSDKIIIAILVILLVVVVLRVSKQVYFDANVAKILFVEDRNAYGFKALKPMSVMRNEAIAGKEFTVAQWVEQPNRERVWFIQDWDNRRCLMGEWIDTTGDIYRLKMAKSALEFNREMRKDLAKYTEADANELAKMAVDDYVESKKTMKGGTAAQRAAENRDIQSVDRSKKNLPRYDEKGGVIG